MIYVYWSLVTVRQFWFNNIANHCLQPFWWRFVSKYTEISSHTSTTRSRLQMTHQRLAHIWCLNKVWASRTRKQIQVMSRFTQTLTRLRRTPFVFESLFLKIASISSIKIDDSILNPQTLFWTYSGLTFVCASRLFNGSTSSPASLFCFDRSRLERFIPILSIDKCVSTFNVCFIFFVLQQ